MEGFLTAFGMTIWSRRAFDYWSTIWSWRASITGRRSDRGRLPICRSAVAAAGPRSRFREATGPESGQNGGWRDSSLRSE